MQQRRLGYITTYCRGCQGYRKHALWKIPGRRGRHVLTCHLCACERGFEDEPSEEPAREHARQRAPRKRRDCRTSAPRPTAQECEALKNAAPPGTGGDEEDRAVLLAAYLRSQEIQAEPVVVKEPSGPRIYVRLPSGVTVDSAGRVHQPPQGIGD